MVTLFQLHANMGNFKAIIKEMNSLWQAGDSVLLLGETAAYLDWFDAYISDLNADDEFEGTINGIANIYVLSDDIEALNDSAKLAIDFSKAIALTDDKWVRLTQKVDRVITLGVSL